MKLIAPTLEARMLAPVRLMILAALVGSTCEAVSAQSVRDFAGSYDLVRTEALDDSGQWQPSEVFGAGPSGVIMYDGLGTMGVQIVRGDRVAADGSAQPGRYFAYFGSYAVNAAAGTVTHRLENHTNPAQATNDNVRGFDFDGDFLTLTVEPQRQLRLVWQRRR